LRSAGLEQPRLPKEVRECAGESSPVPASARALTAATFAATDWLLVSDRDDETAALANRMAAVADPVATMDGRLQRTQAATPPSPIVPPSPVYPALVAVQ
jgi:hypothetical protein